MKILPFPHVESVPILLRKLADKMEAGEFGAVDSMAYVFDGPDGISCGLLGLTSEIHGCGLFTIGAQFLAQEACE